jgi:hypothetical protein
MIFFVNEQELSQGNSAICGVNTRNRDYLHKPVFKLPCYQKSACYAASNFSTVCHKISEVS